MSQINTQRFIEMVARSNLVQKGVLEEFVKALRERAGGETPTNTKKVAEAFEKAGLLTPWHTEKILEGKYKGFFLGKYKLLGHIGTGGMSSVYLAEHTRMHDKRAIKVLPKKRINDASYLARFQLEAKAIASLNHPNIVLAHDIDNEGDVHYIVMEYVDGDDLQTHVKRKGPMDFAMAADVIRQAANGLQHAHSKGVIHRDVKPANLLIDSDGKVRLLDMGLALVDEGDNASLTVAHNENVLGTADYLAPEQALNSHSVDHRADIYGLGCTLYFLLTGQPPFNEGSLAQRIAKHQNQMPQSIRELRPKCPGELEGICVKMIQKEPKYRYSSAADVAETLSKFLAAIPKGEPVRVGGGSGRGGSGSGSRSGHGSSNALSDSKRSESSIRGDTVSAKNDDTLASTRSKLLRGDGISASDSGRLVSVSQKGIAPEAFEGSFLDLEIESGFRGVSKIYERAAQSTAAGGSSLNPAGDSAVTHQSSRSKIANSANDNEGVSAQRGRPGQGKRQGVDPMLIVALVTALFIVALAFGYFLAKVTS